MLFNSLTFFIFFAVFYAAYLAVRRNDKARLALIVAGSAVFYGWWDWRFLLLILSTGLVDFFASLGMEHFSGPRIRRGFLILSLAFDLGMLAIFKYSSFIAENLEALLSMLGLHADLQSRIPAFCLILPVGISFYTFQSLSYTIDVYRRKLPPTHDFIHFMAYLMFFPQLVAGPIVRAENLLYRLSKAPLITSPGIVSGVKLIVIGFFKKCFLADNVAYYVNSTFAGAFACDSTVVWAFTMILFSIQIYCDFSGYSDIARGLARLLGYRFPLNFDHPYASLGFRDFWRRWHISLSSWFMNYVYIPLGGNVEKYRGAGLLNRWRTTLNLFVTMLLSGLWHGAAWNFLLWGAVHGCLLSLERILHLPRLLGRGYIGKTLWWLVTLFCIPLTWVFFRAESLSQVGHIFKCLFVYSPMPEDSNITKSFCYICIFIIMEIWLWLRPVRFLPYRIARLIYQYDAVGFALLAVATIFFRGDGNEFIYFQF